LSDISILSKAVSHKRKLNCRSFNSRDSQKHTLTLFTPQEMQTLKHINHKHPVKTHSHAHTLWPTDQTIHSPNVLAESAPLCFFCSYTFRLSTLQNPVSKIMSKRRLFNVRLLWPRATTAKEKLK